MIVFRDCRIDSLLIAGDDRSETKSVDSLSISRSEGPNLQFVNTVIGDLTVLGNENSVGEES